MSIFAQLVFLIVAQKIFVPTRNLKVIISIQKECTNPNKNYALSSKTKTIGGKNMMNTILNFK